MHGFCAFFLASVFNFQRLSLSSAFLLIQLYVRVMHGERKIPPLPDRSVLAKPLVGAALLPGGVCVLAASYPGWPSHGVALLLVVLPIMLCL